MKSDIHSQFERMKHALTPRQLSRLGAYEASRNAQLQKARREIEENEKVCDKCMQPHFKHFTTRDKGWYYRCASPINWVLPK